MTGNGRMRRRIEVQRATVVPNSLNEGVETWATIYAPWAIIADVSTREKLRAQEVQADLDTRFTIRWSVIAESISATDRIVYGGRIYGILGTKEKEALRWIEIDATRRNDVAMAAGDVSP